jgi:hypothetical protein
MDLKNARSAAAISLVNFQKRLAQFGGDPAPLELVHRWKLALHQDPPDLNAMKSIVEDAAPLKDRFGDIYFFTFCNTMDAVLRDVTQDFLADKRKPDADAV